MTRRVDVDLADVDPATLWSQVSWLPQRPVLEPGTIASIVGGADDRRRGRAARASTRSSRRCPTAGHTELGPRRRGPQPRAAAAGRPDPGARLRRAAGDPRRADRAPRRGGRGGRPRHGAGAAGRRADGAARGAPPVARRVRRHGRRGPQRRGTRRCPHEPPRGRCAAPSPCSTSTAAASPSPCCSARSRSAARSRWPGRPPG